jgi:hypothetical protein
MSFRALSARIRKNNGPLRAVRSEPSLVGV